MCIYDAVTRDVYARGPGEVKAISEFVAAVVVYVYTGGMAYKNDRLADQVPRLKISRKQHLDKIPTVF